MEFEEFDFEAQQQSKQINLSNKDYISQNTKNILREEDFRILQSLDMSACLTTTMEGTTGFEKYHIQSQVPSILSNDIKTENYDGRLSESRIYEEDKSIDEEISYKCVNFQLVPNIPVDKNQVFDLFCDIPVHLEHFLREAGCGSEVSIPVRSCVYNQLKKVGCIESFNHGTIIEAKMSSGFQACQNFTYLTEILKSKGNQKLYDLSQLISTYQQSVNKISSKVQEQIQNQNQSFLDKRREAANKKKMEILNSLDPRKAGYYKYYQSDLQNGGSLKLTGYGFLKGYTELMGMTLAEYKQFILRKGFMENLLYCDKIRTMLQFFANIPWGMQESKIQLQHPIDCLTYDNIMIHGDLVVDTYNLCFEFDQENQFKCESSDIILLLTVLISPETSFLIQTMRSKRGLRNLDEDNENVQTDFTYSQESQSFLELYYKDLYGPEYVKKKQLRQCEYFDIAQYQPQIPIKPLTYFFQS